LLEVADGPADGLDRKTRIAGNVLANHLQLDGITIRRRRTISADVPALVIFPSGTKGFIAGGPRPSCAALRFIHSFARGNGRSARAEWWRVRAGGMLGLESPAGAL
jgi:hypothetical protein